MVKNFPASSHSKQQQERAKSLRGQKNEMKLRAIAHNGSSMANTDGSTNYNLGCLSTK